MYVVSRYENPYEHSRGDTVERIDLHVLEKVSRAVGEVLRHEAGPLLTGVTGGEERSKEAAPGAGR